MDCRTARAVGIVIILSPTGCQRRILGQLFGFPLKTPTLLGRAAWIAKVRCTASFYKSQRYRAIVKFCGSSPGKRQMACCQFFLVCQFLVVAVVGASVPESVLAASDMVNYCQPHLNASALPDRSVRIFSLNMSHGRNTALNQLFVDKERTYQNLDKIAVLLDTINPDVVALQEADAPSRWSGNFDHVAYVAQQSGFPCLVHGLHSRTWISSYRTALLSRSRPAESASMQFSPSWPSKQKGFVSATLDWSVGQQRVSITFVSVHLDFLRARVRDRQVSELVKYLSDIDGPLVLMGDLNSQWALDKSPVRMLADELDLRAFYPERDGLGTYKKSSGKRLDWILISQELEFREFKVLPDVVADHSAVYAEITYRGE